MDREYSKLIRNLPYIELEEKLEDREGPLRRFNQSVLIKKLVNVVLIKTNNVDEQKNKKFISKFI